MLNIVISEEDKLEAEKERFEHPDIHVQRRLHALYFKALGYAHKEICLLAGVSYTTLELVFKLYLEGGLEKVRSITYYSPHSQLDEHRVSIEEYCRQHPPATVAEACKIIKDLTGVERGTTQVRHFLIRLGLRPRKAGAMPGKVDPQKQEAFKKKSSSQNSKKPLKESVKFIS